MVKIKEKKVLTSEQKAERKERIAKYAKLIAQFIVFILPVLSAVLQVEFQESELGIHWRIFISALIGGGLATVVEALSQIYHLKEKDYDVQLEELEKAKRKAEYERDIAEKDVKLACLDWNEQWFEANATIEFCEKMEKTIQIKKAELEKQKGG